MIDNQLYPEAMGASSHLQDILIVYCLRGMTEGELKKKTYLHFQNVISQMAV